ncbi:3-oxoacyl-[acyl-carrier-protein] synthase III [Saccharothrix carnea]|uniref:Beta-ketoacyl-[acyl-carrier-protein] synthase III n=1 Tax=Saccharothrix carnea TaxID=1280637 RepID=A0A2P8IFI6_SACCR|nr:beta-ketoacyl-ACP synthase III [Saccharothrix carnea]PSL57235.1 3-oxoacyl-[acyl-carrier-protein] synthase III [Saccharothrix carnea]
MSRAAVVRGLGAVVPPDAVTNAMLAERMDTSDEWIRTRTGIGQRHVVAPGVATSDLAVDAGSRALKAADVDHVDLVVVATTTPDHPCPATAPSVAARLGLGHVPAYDLAAVCTGFVYALASGAGAVASGLAKSVLVIGAETYSSILDPTDRTTSVIFGDGAGAVVLGAGEHDEPGALLEFDLGSDGTLADVIMIPGGGSRQRSGGVPADPADVYFRMDGKRVFRAAVQRMAGSARVVLDRAGWRVDDVDRFVGHQANVRILRAVAEELGLAPDRLVVNLDKVGNTSAASIPLALADAAQRDELSSGDRVVLSAFGGGVTWGACALVWPDIAVF